MDTKRTERRAFVAAGQVQGVGFRPFVYRLAREGGLTGTVGNTSEGVRMEVQGAPGEVARFGRRLRDELPPLARLVALTEEELSPLSGETAFVIVPSSGHAGHSVLVSPDMGVCPDCLADMRDPGNRRYAYPFTNCTNCGPRYTITRSIPYDRAVTSMSCFPLCPECAAEYGDPADRRFHAQPIACPFCGPRLWFVDKRVLADGADTGPTPENRREALVRAGQILLDGGILALKGLGGFQLACDARNAGALRELRRRKSRPHKPLALMVGDLAAARSFCRLTPEHEALLQSPEKPIVLCPRLPGLLPGEVAPDTHNLGLMLPYTPLHAVLFDLLKERMELPPVLVMTSANAGGEPICLGNREALARLRGLADAWLLHDRDILVRVDDSVLTVAPLPPRPLGTDAASMPDPAASAVADKAASGGAPAGARGVEPLFFRRARGYVPRPVFLPDDGPTVLGAGAELKGTICLTRHAEAFVGQHIGDLENPATLGFYEETASHLEGLLEVRPRAIVCDLHPDFLSTRYAEARAAKEGLPLWRLQHHAAHAASVLAENSHYAPALALCLDGTGLGTDKTIWGGELLCMDLNQARWSRLGRLSPFALPGGEAAIREPWRIALALQHQCGISGPAPWRKDYATAATAVNEMLRRKLNCPQTSSCGRLFDAVAAQLGLCLAAGYEGQAAIRLEAAVDDAALQSVEAWPVEITERNGLLELDSAALFARVLEDQKAGLEPGLIAARFHGSLAHGFTLLSARAAHAAGLRSVGLSGGVLQNALLARLLPELLAEQSLVPLTHHELPPGDGGLSLGQAVWGRRLLLGA